MADALTPLQVDIMRRVRDSQHWSADGSPDQPLREAIFLCGLGLVAYVEVGRFELTELGREYLEAIESARRQAN